MRPVLTEGLATQFATLALGHVTREYPNYLTHALSGPADALTPQKLHPVFYGSYDWHSCVHGYWMLARLLEKFPDMAPGGNIRALFDAQLTPEKIAGECAYLRRPMAGGFERPYGWAWMLKLGQQIGRLGEPRWSGALAPLVKIFVECFEKYLPKATYPVRAGTHFNSAFALALAADYAASAGDGSLGALLWRTGEGWYGADADCQAWEPGGDDFLSPALIEAECLRRLMPQKRFLDWFGRFLPRVAEGRPACLFSPALVSDRSDGKIAHLDGLNLSRAWCWRSLAGALAEGDARRAGMQAAADSHLAAGLAHVSGDYMGEHWLASFAVLALDGG